MSALQDEISQAVKQLIPEIIAQTRKAMREEFKAMNEGRAEHISLQDAAKILKVSTQTLRRRASLGEIKIHRIGKKIYFNRYELFTNGQNK